MLEQQLMQTTAGPGAEGATNGELKAERDHLSRVVDELRNVGKWRDDLWGADARRGEKAG